MTAAWVREALQLAATDLAADGVAYLLPRRVHRRRLRSLVAKHGLSVELEVVHLPQLASSVFLVPLDPGPIQFVLGELVLLPTWRRAATLLFARRGPLRVPFSSIGFVIRRPGSRPCFHWLSELDGGTPTRAVISRTRPGAGPGFFVLHRFREGDFRPSAVAKVAPSHGGAIDRESSALESIARTARDAGADVPEPLTTATVGSARVLLLKPLQGHLAATLLTKAPQRLEQITSDVARWLVAWASRTAVPLVLTHELLERTLGQPARLLAEQVRGGRDYAERIERVCEAVEGRKLVGSSAHNDLTMWNVIAREGGHLGVVDWETATETSFPLVDFYYAAADAVAATEGYTDRTRSFGRAFGDESGVGRWISALEQRMIRELRLERWAAQLGFHACWLHHATNELRRADGGNRSPFVRIIERIGDSGSRPSRDGLGTK
jgi:hypothetical protein